MRKDEGRRLLIVGASLAVAIAALVVVVALLGRSQSLFVTKVRLHTSFQNTSGLMVGAPVRLAGVDIGIVQAIRFDKDLRSKDVHVVLGVGGKYLERIRKDSVARLSTKGLLGDMLINITVGGADSPPLRDGDHVPTEESVGLAEIATSVQRAVGEVEHLAGDVDRRLRVVLSEDVARDLARAVRSSANIIEKVERGDGLLHAVVYKPQLAQGAQQLLADGQVAAARLSGALGRVDHVLAALETGHGALHELLYGQKGQALIDDLGGAVREIGGVVAEVRKGDGLLHELVFGDDGAALVKDLGRAARIVRTLAEETQQGKGTLGALLKDPTVYEDLKTTLGNVTRNRFLKAIVRYAIKKDALERQSAAP